MQVIKQEHELKKKARAKYLDREDENEKYNVGIRKQVNIPVSKSPPFEGHPFQVKGTELLVKMDDGKIIPYAAAHS